MSAGRSPFTAVGQHRNARPTRMMALCCALSSSGPVARLGGSARCACRHVNVTAVVVPTAGSLRQRLRLRVSTAAFRELTARLGLRVLPFGSDFGECDLICVGAFPRLISREMRDRARLGAINVHPSLLPRHRGPDPLFWTTSMTISTRSHSALARRFDDGDVIAQKSILSSEEGAEWSCNCGQRGRSDSRHCRASQGTADRTSRIRRATQSGSKGTGS